MIYKIIAEFEEELERVIKELSKKFIVLFYRNVIYVASKEDEIEKTEVEKMIKSIIKESFYCQELNEKNLKYEPDKVIEWCRDKFVEKETKKFEKEKQELLKAYVTLIKDLEIELKKEVEEGE